MKKRARKRTTRKRPVPVGVSKQVRMGLYDACSDAIPNLIGPVWDLSSRWDAVMIKMMISTYNDIARRRKLTLCMGVFPAVE